MPSSGKKVEDGLGKGVRKLSGLLILNIFVGTHQMYTLSLFISLYVKSVHQNIVNKYTLTYLEESILMLAIYYKTNKKY